MNDIEGTHYPNIEPDGLGDLKRIKRLPGMRSKAPPIKWGADYQKLSLRRRLRYAENIASAMNHAADVIQTERQGLIEVARQQEKQIKQLAAELKNQGEIINSELTRANEEKQELLKKIVEQKHELLRLERLVKQLED
jgi:hypothetical protein